MTGFISENSKTDDVLQVLGDSTVKVVWNVNNKTSALQVMLLKAALDGRVEGNGVSIDTEHLTIEVVGMLPESTWYAVAARTVEVKTGLFDSMQVRFPKGTNSTGKKNK